jgi:hypothetical protein
MASYNSVAVVEVEAISDEAELDLLTGELFAMLAAAKAAWQAETDAVLGLLGTMAATASDADSETLSRAMALIEMADYV